VLATTQWTVSGIPLSFRVESVVSRSPHTVSSVVTSLPPAGEGSRYRLSLALLALSFFNYSFGGLIVRSVEVATPWQMVYWRGAGLAILVFIVLLVRAKGDFFKQIRGAGRWGLLAGLSAGFSPLGYIFALQYTTVANTMFILATIPFITAILARLLLKETIARHTLIAIPVAFTGVGVMVGGGFSQGAGTGNLIAISTALLFSATVLLLRRGRALNMQPFLLISGIVAVVAGTVATGGDVGVPLWDACLLLFWGAGLTGCGYLIMLFASRHVPSAEITFLMMIEFILSPIWVWVFFDEVPRTLTMIGGLIVLSAVAGWTFANATRTR
jgi:DME family drug/metabolite transporter